jgi:hypothetical protein
MLPHTTLAQPAQIGLPAHQAKPNKRDDFVWPGDSNF